MLFWEHKVKILESVLIRAFQNQQFNSQKKGPNEKEFTKDRSIYFFKWLLTSTKVSGFVIADDILLSFLSHFCWINHCYKF